uniref:DNA primase n=1 Tax=Pithovirus LCPAC406 TaxID=2506599 RepID=A0A481ZDB9_9VIRU|nr:MAG: DNA primase [Pithovirus LCPAC406]
MSYRIINDKRWYYRLYNGPKLYNGLFDSSPLTTSGIVISLEDSDGYRLFALFDDHIELFKYIIAFEPERRCFYEVITQTQKHKYDIDIKGQSYEFANAILDDLLRSIDKVYKDIFNIDLNDSIIVYQSHGTNKFSYHVIIDGYCLNTPKECEKIYQLTIELMESQYSEYVDSSVYKSTQQMRLLWSHKAKSDRTKHLMKTFKFRGEIQDMSKRVNRKQKQGEHLTLLAMFTESLVSVTHSCILISIDIEKKETVLYETIEHDSGLVYSIFVKTLKGKNPFKLLSERGNLILLKRISPSYCNVCLRVHENENPYLIVSSGVIYFDCRRSNGERKTIGYLESIDKSIVDKEECIPTSESISAWYESILNKISENDTVNEYGSVRRCFSEKNKQHLSRFDSLMLCGNEFSS